MLLFAGAQIGETVTQDQTSTLVENIPYLSVSEPGDISIFLPFRTSAQLQWFDKASGNLVGPVSPLVTIHDLEAFRSAMIQEIQQQFAALRNYTQQRFRSSDFNSQSQIVSFAAAQVFDLSQKVEFGNVSAINSHVLAAVENLQLGLPSSNLLFRELTARQTESSQCACFDPQALSALNTTVVDVVDIVAQAIACESQGLVSREDLGSAMCYFTTTVPNCGSTIVGLDSNADADCGLISGNTNLGSECEASCRLGFRAGISVSSTFVCGLDGMWNGTLSCQGLGVVILYVLRDYFILSIISLKLPR